MDSLLARSPAERRETARRAALRGAGWTVGLVACIVGFLIMVVVGGFIISLFTNALMFTWNLAFG